MSRPITTVETRLFQRLTTDGTCWIYEGTLNRDGYGVITAGGRLGRKLRVHRVAWEVFRGPIPDGLTIDHLCRNRACCNPEHLDAVPQGVNARRGQDATRKTHCPKGHEYTTRTTNRRADRNGSRTCRVCKADYDRRRNATRGIEP